MKIKKNYEYIIYFFTVELKNNLYGDCKSCKVLDFLLLAWLKCLELKFKKAGKYYFGTTLQMFTAVQVKSRMENCYSELILVQCLSQSMVNYKKFGQRYETGLLERDCSRFQDFLNWIWTWTCLKTTWGFGSFFGLSTQASSSTQTTQLGSHLIGATPLINNA